MKIYVRMLLFGCGIVLADWSGILAIPTANAQLSRLTGDQYTYSATNLRGDVGEVQNPIDELDIVEHAAPAAVLTFDGIAETVGGIIVNETVTKWAGVPGGIPLVQEAGIDGEFEFDALGWESAGEILEFQFDSVDGRWISEDLLDPSLITLRGLDWKNSDAGSEPFLFEDGFYIYFAKDGVPITGYETQMEGIGVLTGKHPLDPNVDVFYIAYSRRQVEEVSEVSPGSVDFTFGTTQLDPSVGWAELAALMAVDGQIDATGGTNGINGLRLGVLVDEPNGPDVFLPGDVNLDGTFNASDYDAMGAGLRDGLTGAQYDTNSDGTVDRDDYFFLVEAIGNTYIGDSNLDGVFDSGDLVAVFTIGEYEDDVPSNSTWTDGDWNGSGDFDSGDFVDAFSRGGYDVGARNAIASVPEPSSILLLVLGVAITARTSRLRRGR